MLKEKLRFLRRNKEYTQKEIARLLKISPTGYANWEQGNSEPNSEYLKKICVIYDISADELLEIETESERKQIHINN